MEATISVNVSISPFKIFAKFNILVHKLGLSLVTFINCCSKKSLDGIQTEYQWTSENILTTFLTKSLMGSSFIGNFYYSTLSDFVAVTTLSIIFMWLCECKYIWMQICIYVVMFVLPRYHNPQQRYFNNEAFQLIQKDPDIVSQEISLLEHMVNLGGVCPKIM